MKLPTSVYIYTRVLIVGLCICICMNMWCLICNDQRWINPNMLPQLISVSVAFVIMLVLQIWERPIFRGNFIAAKNYCFQGFHTSSFQFYISFKLKITHIHIIIHTYSYTHNQYTTIIHIKITSIQLSHTYT
jgi:hypothetical protein